MASLLKNEDKNNFYSVRPQLLPQKVEEEESNKGLPSVELHHNYSKKGQEDNSRIVERMKVRNYGFTAVEF